MTIDYIYMLFVIIHFNRRLAVEIHLAAFNYSRHSYRGDIISNTNIISQFKNKQIRIKSFIVIQISQHSIQWKLLDG